MRFFSRFVTFFWIYSYSVANMSPKQAWRFQINSRSVSQPIQTTIIWNKNIQRHALTNKNVRHLSPLQHLYIYIYNRQPDYPHWHDNTNVSPSCRNWHLAAPPASRIPNLHQQIFPEKKMRGKDGWWLFRVVPYKSRHNKCMATHQVHSGTPLKYLQWIVFLKCNNVFLKIALISSSLFTRTLHHHILSHLSHLCPQWQRAACNANDPCTVGLRHLCGDAAYSPRSSAHHDHVTFGWSTQDAAHPNEGGDTRGDAKEVQRGFLRNLRNLGVRKNDAPSCSRGAKESTSDVYLC